MATRSLTDVFILMRNNSMQTRHIYSEQNVSDRMSLVSRDIESGYELRHGGGSGFPPTWADGLEEVQYSLTRLRAKIRELESLHSRHLHRPTLDESSEEEQHIENLTQEITRMFGTAQRLVQQIRQQSSEGRGRQEQRLSYNVVSTLVAVLQELSTAFRQTQNSYVKKLDSREERSRQLLASPLQEYAGDKWEIDTDLEHIDKQFATQTQLLLLEEENTRMAEHRETEVRDIVRSIWDLNHVFKDLAHMIADQGTILDRIDYNIEQCQIEVQKGYQQLKKADEYQKKNRKVLCIIILAAVTLILVVILIIVKS